MEIIEAVVKSAQDGAAIAIAPSGSAAAGTVTVPA